MSFPIKNFLDNARDQFFLRSPKIFSDFNKWEKILLVTGFILLTVRLIYYPPIFADEATRILTVQKYSFWELTHLSRFKSSVHDAWGFLALVKLFGLLRPEHEIFFRLPVFLCSLLGIFLFFRLSRKLLAPAGRYTAMGLYIVCPCLLMYCNEMLPYMCDVLCSTLLLGMFLRLIVSDLRSWNTCLGYAFLGGMTLILSLPAVFTLAGGSLVVFLRMISAREKDQMRKFLTVAVFWAVIWGIYYFWNVRHFTQWNYLVDDWEPYLFPSVWILQSLVYWFLERFTAMFDYPLGIYPWVGMPLWFLGLGVLFRQERFQAALIISSFCMMLLAVFLRKYPFYDRVLAFLLPMNMILIGRGWHFFVHKICRLRSMRWLAPLVIGLLFYRPITSSLRIVNYTHKNEGVPAVLDHIQTNWQEGDGIYIQWDFRHEFLFLNRRYGFRSSDYVQGFYRESYKSGADIAKLRKYHRVWFILGGMHKQRQKGILSLADQRGELIETYPAGWCYVSLYRWDPENPFYE